MGGSRREDLLVDRGHQSWVPAPEGAGEILVEHLRADLEQQMCSAWGPAHLLFLDLSSGGSRMAGVGVGASIVAYAVCDSLAMMSERLAEQEAEYLTLT